MRGLLAAVGGLAIVAILSTAEPPIAGAASPSAGAIRAKGAGGSGSLSTAPAALKRAVESDLGADVNGVHELGVSYNPSGAQFSGNGFGFSVGHPGVGRGSALVTASASLTRLTSGAVYGEGSVEESFRPVTNGIEQSFKLKSRLRGSGPVVIQVPVEALSAHDSGGAIALVDQRGEVRATYLGLRVTDAVGHVIEGRMNALVDGRGIELTIEDARAQYPIMVDPTWSQVSEPTASDGAASDYFGASVSISGTTAVVGAFGHTVNGNSRQGAVYVYTSTGGSWNQAAELTASDGAAGEDFGASVSISGSTIVVGAPYHKVGGNYPGEVYVFTGTGSSWTRTAEFTASDDGGSDQFGWSVAVSGSTIVVGANEHTVSGRVQQGAAYVFSGIGGSWSQTAELTASDGASGDYFGASVAITGSTVVVGAIYHTANGHYEQGSAYVFTSGGASWSQSAELNPSDGGASDDFGLSVAVSGSTVFVGAKYHAVTQMNQGAAYVFTMSGGSWSQKQELTASDMTALGGDYFGASVSVSGLTLAVGAYGHPVNGINQGATYLFAWNGTSWVQTTELTASDGANGDEFGYSIAVSVPSVIVGAYNHSVSGHASQGAAYVFSSLLVQPQGSAFSADGVGGVSGSDPACGCGGGVPARASRGGPVDTGTGDLYTSAPDLSLPGAGVPLVFSRTYDAQASQAEVAAGSAAPALGFGWSYNLGMSLAYNSSNQNATVTEEKGAQQTFTPFVSGSSPAWCNSSSNYCSPAPRVQSTLNHNGDGTWTYTRATGGQRIFKFNMSGSLTSMADAFGNTLTSSTYSAGSGQTACPSGDICTGWTSSASGRELVVAVNGSGRLASVFDANSTLAANFIYTGGGCTTWGSGQTADLCSAVDPGGLTYSYTYDSGNSNANYVYDMLSENPPGNSAASTDLYDTSGRVTQQTDPSGAVMTFAYSGTNSTLQGGTTTVTNYPLGTGTGKPQDVTVYQYSSNVLVSETSGSGASSSATQFFQRDPVSLMTLSTEDGNANVASSAYQTYSETGGTPVSSGNLLSATDSVGNTTAHAYNSFNQAWCSVDAADYANGKRCPSTPPTSPPAPGVADPNLGVSLTFYNSSDQLTATTDALGNTTTYSYTGTGLGVPAGLMYCSVDPVDYQNNVTCPAYGAAHVTGTTTSTFDSAGDRLTSTDRDGDTTSYVYNAAGHPGLVSSQSDPDGTVTTFSYNGAGQVNSRVVSFGSYSATTSNAYDSLGRQYCTVSPYETSKGVTCPASAPSSPPTPSNDPYLGATITTYDSLGRVIQTTNPLGGITYTGFDQAGEAFCTVSPFEAALNVTCPSNPPSSPPTIGNDPYLGATITSYDANGRVAQVTNPLGGITLTSYDQANNVTQTTVESNNTTSAPNVVTTKTYDADNRVVSTTLNPGTSLAATTESFYDPNGNPFCTVSANALTAGGFQCPIWQPGWITTPPSPTSLYSTTPTSTQANKVTTAFFNANGGQVQTTDPDVNTNITAVEGDGRTYCSSDPTNVSAWLGAHPTGTYPYLCPSTPPSTPPAQGSNPGYVTTLYDAAGRKTSNTDQLGDTTSYTYDASGHVLTTTDPRGKVTTNCYYYQNGTGQCANSAPAGGGSGDDLYSTTTPSTTADPLGQVTTATYYPGDLTNVTMTPAGTTTAAYDAALDLASVNYSNTATGYTTPTNLAYTYNVDRSRHTMTDATGTTTYSYDAASDVTSQALTAATGTGLTNATTSYTYFTTGALNTVVYPSYTGHTNPTVTYAYDATGAMTSETDWLANKVTFSHDTDGNQTNQANNVSTSNPNGTSSTALTYDLADLNTQTATTMAQACGGNETLSQSFTGTSGSRNPDGQLTQYQTAYTGSCSGQTGTQRNYSYDLAGRVVYQSTTTQGANPNNFAYDPSGDPTTISSHDNSANFDTYTQTFDNAGETLNQTPIVGSQGSSSTYTYDTLGDQTTAVTGTAISRYSFDQTGHMVTFTPPTGSATSYLYDGNGLQTAATASGMTKQLVWNTTGQMPLVLSDSTNHYIYGPNGQPVEQIALGTSTPTYLTYTPSNSTWISTNAAGDQTGYWAYDAYGNLATGTPASPFGYSGQYTDTTTGLVNDRARWYQPQTGAFISRDPAFAQTDTAYTYAGGDPVNGSDPTGLMPCLPGGPCGSINFLSSLPPCRYGDYAAGPPTFGFADLLYDWLRPPTTEDSQIPGAGITPQKADHLLAQAEKWQVQCLSNGGVIACDAAHDPLTTFEENLAQAGKGSWGDAILLLGAILLPGAAPESELALGATEADSVVAGGELSGPGPSGGESSAAAYGRYIHGVFDYGPGFEREFTLPSGKRADAVNFLTREVLELKPNNPAAIARGLRQAEGYASELNNEYSGGTPWTFYVVTYGRP